MDESETKLLIFARVKDDIPEFYVGCVDYIDEFHNPDAWNLSYDECRPITMYDFLQETVDMLALVYTEYEFRFYELKFTKRESNESDNVKIGIDDNHN